MFEKIKIVLKGEIFDIFYGDISNGCDMYTKSSIINEVLIGEDIIYSDGEGIWKVINKNDFRNTVEALNDCTVVHGKALNYGKLIYCEDVSLYKDAISFIHPSCVALFFVSSSAEIVKFKAGLPNDIEVISKIESTDGLSNIYEIAL